MTASARAIRTAQRSMIARASGSPASAAALSRLKAASMRTVSHSSSGRGPAMRSRASRTIASGVHVTATHPRAPHQQGGPSGSTMICPISPELSRLPRMISSSITRPAPTPVPR